MTTLVEKRGATEVRKSLSQLAIITDILILSGRFATPKNGLTIFAMIEAGSVSLPKSYKS